MDTSMVRGLVERCEAAMRDGRAQGRAMDDDDALAALTTVLTAEAGETVEALGFGAANGGPVPMVVIAGSDWGAFVATEILTAGAGLVAVHQREEPADIAAWPQYPNGMVVTAYARPAVETVVETVQVAA